MGKNKAKNKDQNMTATNPESVEVVEITEEIYASDIPVGMRNDHEDLTEEERAARKSEGRNM